MALKKVGVKALSPLAKLPVHASEEAAGADICAINKVILLPGASAVIETGLAFDIPKGFMLEAVGRSGHGFKNGIRLANSIGVVDNDYKGELRLKIHNDGNEAFIVEPGDRIGQIMLREYFQGDFGWVDELSKSVRGENGYGSTGVK